MHSFAYSIYSLYLHVSILLIIIYPLEVKAKIYAHVHTVSYFIKLVQQPFQSVDLLDPIVGSQRNEIHGNQVFRIVILDSF